MLNKKWTVSTETRCVFETSQKCSSDSKLNTLHSSKMHYKQILNFENQKLVSKIFVNETNSLLLKHEKREN